MVEILLTGGAYSALGFAANAQRSLNLYPEASPQEEQAPTPVTQYPCPGLSLEGTILAGSGGVRSLYTATNGTLYAAVGNSIFSINYLGQSQFVGVMTGGNSGASTPVSFADNGEDMLMVDGSGSGWGFNFSSKVFNPISASTNNADLNGFAFYGGHRVDYVDGYFVGDQVGTPVIWNSQNNEITFDALAYASKSGLKDPMTGVVVLDRVLVAIGTYTTEFWSDVGGQPFAFEIISGLYFEHGCCAPWTICKVGDFAFWLSQSRTGVKKVVMCSAAGAKFVSNYALEAELLTYTTLADAKGFSYQYSGHTFYFLQFPSLGKTWCYDMDTGEWHERASLSAGVEVLWVGGSAASAYDQIWVGDNSSPKLYQLAQLSGEENGNPMLFLRGFPHAVSEMNRIAFRKFTANLGVDNGALPTITLAYSNDRGQTFSASVSQTLVQAQGFLQRVMWRRLGMARDRVWQLSWQGPGVSSLGGAFVDFERSSN